MLKKILVPYDFSAGSRLALSTACQLALRCGAELLVMIAIERSPDDPVLKLVTLPKDLESHLRKKIEEEIGAAAPEAAPAQIHFQTMVRMGKAAVEVLLAAETEKPDLIVMGTKGKTGLKHILLGSVAETVVRRAGVPVWVCRGAGPTLPKKILLPVDFSSFSREALEQGARWAKELKAEAILLHVVDMRDLNILVPLGVEAGPSPVTEIKKQAEAQLKSWAEAIALPAKLEVRLGNALNEIQNSIEENSCDLVLLSTHGRTGLKNLIMGSVAEQTVRYSPCSVMTIRPSAMTLSNLKIFESEREFEEYIRSFRD